MSVLLTGFEPFNGADKNPSWEAVQRVPEVICGQTVHRMCLPVEYTAAAALLLEEIRRLQPEIVICCGVASGRTSITPELVALNYRMAAIPDNAGRLYSGEPILPGGPTAIMTRLPIHDLAAVIRAEDIPAQVSLSAGAYVCNDLYYHLLEAEPAYRYRGIFIHVPEEKEVDADRAALALTACIRRTLTAE